MKITPVFVAILAMMLTAAPARAESLRLNIQQKINEIQHIRQERKEEIRISGEGAKVILRKEKHKDRLARVTGIVRGMTNKLDNLSQRLQHQLENTERRLNAIEEAGHDLTVEAELNALKAVVAAMQNKITDAKNSLATISDSATPRDQVKQAREIVRTLRSDLQKVREAFRALHQAVREDL